MFRFRSIFPCVFALAPLLFGFRSLAQTPPAQSANSAIPGPSQSASAGVTAPDTAPAQDWCAPNIAHLPSGVCYAAPSSFAPNRPRTLVIFLHGVIQEGTTWQWNPQRGMSLAARAHGYAVLMPRGRLGISRHRTSDTSDQWTWPTAHVAQQQVENEVIGEWAQARKELEAELGSPFERVWIFGFSNGAYYASSLALRARLPADGFAVFAGGGAPKPFPRGPALRAPIYVGYGLRDRAHNDPRQLGAALRAAHWPSKSVGKPGVGHSIADSQLNEAIEFLDKHRPESAPPPSNGPRAASPRHSAPNNHHGKLK